MEMDHESLIVAGEARELLSNLRRNARFSQWGGTTAGQGSSASLGTTRSPSPLAAVNGSVPLEHRFVQDLKQLRRRRKKTVEETLQPFLEIIRSPEANGVRSQRIRCLSPSRFLLFPVETYMNTA